MKKILSMVFILVLVFVSCKAKQKPGISDDSIIEPPPELNVDVNVADLITTLSDITSTGDAVGWGNNDSGWQSSTTLLTGTTELKDKYLIGILNGAPNNIVYVLGINQNSDILVGSVQQTESGAVSNAIKEAGNSKNWDPRKLVYDIGGGDNYNTGTRTVRIAWSGRAGDPPPSGSKLAFSEFKDYDNDYKHILSGGNGTFSVLPDSKYKVFFVQTDILNPRGFTFNQIKEDNKGSLLNFVYETDKSANRKGWMWNHSDVIYSSTTARVLNPRSIRFAYGNNDYSYPYKPESTVTVKGKKSDALDLSGALPAEADRYDNSAPTGKTIIARSQKQLKGENPNWGDYIGDYIMFLTTVVGYNIRVRDYTGGDVGGLKADKIKEVIIEFDADSFTDANNDGWNAISDTPSRNTQTQEIGSASGLNTPKTYKIPFLLYDPK